MSDTERRLKCGNRWVDPLMGRTSNFVGPYSCGRVYGHKGVHAWDGNGASALWSREGELLMALQQVSREQTRKAPVVLPAESMDDLA